MPSPRPDSTPAPSSESVPSEDGGCLRDGRLLTAEAARLSVTRYFAEGVGSFAVRPAAIPTLDELAYVLTQLK